MHKYVDSLYHLKVGLHIVTMQQEFMTTLILVTGNSLKRDGHKIVTTFAVGTIVLHISIEVIVS